MPKWDLGDRILKFWPLRLHSSSQPTNIAQSRWQSPAAQHSLHTPHRRHSGFLVTPMFICTVQWQRIIVLNVSLCRRFPWSHASITPTGARTTTTSSIRSSCTRLLLCSMHIKHEISSLLCFCFRIAYANLCNLN